ncbi:MAG TPA: hypothetical protein VEA80_10375 [Vitreimonas sp.]|uniref:hypothetical protein n=1 Tax=Vitreimonas sp. TaxID=3069702 RepID=UPI002D6318BD|nr:hypothetical protein [Vitreimonas sp.]HYD87871.1 hypothetical protein [Vitreimonas sp.]
MLNSPLFQLALALLLVFLVMAGLVSLVQQFVVEGFRLRARTLRSSITKLLSDKTYKDEIAKRFYRHPMTAALSGGRAQTTCMEPDTFVVALASAVQPSWSNGDPVLALPASVAALRDGDLKQRLQLVLPAAGASRDEIATAVKAWFNTSAQKMSDRFKADCTALSWAVAAVLTITLNVSTIEIGKRLQANDDMRAALASVTPELAQSQAAFTTLATQPAAPDGETAAAETGADPALSAQEVVTLLTIARCAGGDRDIPVGWPWMADVAERIRGGVDTSANAACAAAQERVAPGSQLAQRLTVLQAASQQVATADLTVQAAPVYGPDFERNGVLEVLLGWLITIVAAAQGAPFWFDAIQRIVGRR